MEILKNKQYAFGLVLLVFSLQCSRPDKKDSVEQIENQTETLSHISQFVNSLSIEDSLKIKSKNATIYVYFNGNCSACIISFLEFVSSLRQTKLQGVTQWFYVGNMDNDYQISYHLESSGIKLTENEHLISDNDHKFISDNPFINSSDLTVILTNEADSILSIGNPFEIEKVKSEYIKYGILD